MKNTYNEPLYYEIAFGFIDPAAQVDLFEQFIDAYSRVKVKRFLDICCGPSLQVRECARRGYQAVGLDLSSGMLAYLKEKAEKEGLCIETVEADMTGFSLESTPVDFAFIMMGSFRFADTDALLRHLDCVSLSLRPGGLYLIENMELDWSNLRFAEQTWTMERDGISVTATYRPTLVSSLEQLSREEVILVADDHGRTVRCVDERIIRNIFPQEFLALVKLNGMFEFIGWFERSSTRPLKEASMDNIALLRRK